MNRKQLSFILCICFSALISTADAGDNRILGGLGYGGAGINQNITSSNSLAAGQAVHRSEGPGVFMIGVERIMSEQTTVSIDHTRGFRLAPFSSGVSFTGFSGRYYFGSIPWGAKEITHEPTLTVIGPHFYVGVGAGLALGSISRPGDLVPDVTASGVYFGFRGGADIPLDSHGFGIRPELMISQTMSSTIPDPSSLSLFSLGCQLYFQW